MLRLVQEGFQDLDAVVEQQFVLLHVLGHEQGVHQGQVVQEEGRLHGGLQPEEHLRVDHVLQVIHARVDEVAVVVAVF